MLSPVRCVAGCVDSSSSSSSSTSSTNNSSRQQPAPVDTREKGIQVVDCSPFHALAADQVGQLGLRQAVAGQAAATAAASLWSKAATPTSVGKGIAPRGPPAARA
jgi:hypothetical protein